MKEGLCKEKSRNIKGVVLIVMAGWNFNSSNVWVCVAGCGGV
ncbi:hypothetical protein HpCOL199_10570 [Helicobacter pylori]